MSDQTPAREYFKKVKPIQGLEEKVLQLGIPFKKNLESTVSVIEFILEGLYVQKKLSRNHDRGYFKEAEKPEEHYYEDFQQRKKPFN